MRINSSDDHATSFINLVGFWPVPPEFTRYNCVQRAYFSTLVFGFVYLRSPGSMVMFCYFLL